jgi:predicted TPR repeat methyltransferase
MFMSSGDLIADRRYDFARDLQLRGDLAAAADLMAQAAELAPGFASAWFALGEMQEELNQNSAAIEAYRKAVAADPADRHGASLRLMRLGATDLSEMPKEYVRSLFDQYAPKFDAALVGDLGYRGPEVLRKAVVAARQIQKKPVHFARVVDLGCGTGLAAKAFASVADTFIGIDISNGMIEQAKALKLYARLAVCDMIEGLATEADASADLVLSADAFVYLKDLAPVLCAAARVLKPGALIGFTVETHAGAGTVIGEGFRYAHSEAAVRDALMQAGLAQPRIESVSTRNDGGKPVPGLVVVASK